MTRRQDGRTQPGTMHPSPLLLASFFVRSRAFQNKRLIEDAFAPYRSLRLGTTAEFPFVIAESVSVLRTNSDVREQSLLLGKIQNLRIASQKLHRIVLLPGDIFSFWRQVGAPWRMRGFAKGREVREGCVIPTTGGGLCQLSGALLEVALSADCELVERHRHTALPADVACDPRRDATLFWNYVDLRFRTPVPILFECYLTGEALVVRVRGKSLQAAIVRIARHSGRTVMRVLNAISASRFYRLVDSPVIGCKAFVHFISTFRVVCAAGAEEGTRESCGCLGRHHELSVQFLNLRVLRWATRPFDTSANMHLE